MRHFTETKYYIRNTTGEKLLFFVKNITFENDHLLITTLGIDSAKAVANQLMVQKQRRNERNLSSDYSVELRKDTPTIVVKGDYEAVMGALRSLDFISEMTYKRVFADEEAKQYIDNSKNPQTVIQSEISISERSPKKM